MFPRRQGFFFLLAAICLFSVVAGAQERRVIAVSVLDKQGKVIEGLTVANFRGKFRDRPVKILSAQLDTSPRRIALLIDFSAGMGKPAQKWEAVWSVAGDAVLGLTPVNSLAVFTMQCPPSPATCENQALYHHSDFLRDQETLGNLLINLEGQRPRGATAIWDALLKTVQVITPIQFADAIYLVSDGIGNVSSTTGEETEMELARSGVRVFVYRISRRAPDDTAWNMKYGEKWCKRIVEATGGLQTRLPPGDAKPAEAAQWARPLYDGIAKVYRLGVELPSRVDKPREWELEVVSAQGKRIRDISVAYPKLLVPRVESSGRN